MARTIRLALLLLIAATASAQTYFATPPQVYVNNTVTCAAAPSVVITIGTSINNGPNATGGDVIGSAYGLNLNGLQDAINNWRDNGANTPSNHCTPGSSCTYTDAAWLVQIPSGTVIQSGAYNTTTNGLLSLPGKAATNGGTEPTQCLVIDSTAPLTPGVMACGRGLPIPGGGARNPGCSSPNDKASMWELELNTPGSGNLTGKLGIAGVQDLVYNLNVPNHILMKDMWVTVTPGTSQSMSGVKAARLVGILSNPLNQNPPATIISANNIGIERSYFSGWDPGDAGQPSGACASWQFSAGLTQVSPPITTNGSVNVAPDGSNPGTSLVTLVPTTTPTKFTGQYFGPTFTVGGQLYLNGAPYTIANTSYTQAVLNQSQAGGQNTQVSVTGSVTISGGSYSITNPPTKYANGCGDDVAAAVVFNCDNCWFGNNYIEKIHEFGDESHAIDYGFDNGPQKYWGNWVEGGSIGMFSGGAPVDSNGGPGNDVEIRENYVGKDLNWQFLSANAGSSPAAPFGCGTLSGSYTGGNGCPFQYAIKNDFELKLGHRILVNGNVIDGSWSDGQSGFCVLINVRTASGGETAGIFDPSTGLPKTYIDNIRFANNWIRNCPQPIQMSNRSGIPGNGGGVSLPVIDNDFVNNLFTNVGDDLQSGNPGNQWEWTDGQNTFHCVMSYTGSGPYTVTGQCVPYQADFSTKVTKISSVANVVTVNEANRSDPMLSSTSAGTTTISNVDDITTGWQVCSYTNPPPVFCAGGSGIPTGISQTFGNASPSLDGGSMAVAVTGPAYSNVEWYYDTGASNQTTTFTEDEHFYVASITNLQALEFDAFQYLHAGDGGAIHDTRLYFGTECVTPSGSPSDWFVWDSSAAAWVDTNQACSFNTAAWNHLVIQTHRIYGDTSCSGGYPKMYYDSIAVNGVATVVNIATCSGALPVGYAEMTGVTVQVDTNSVCGAGCTVTEYVDEMNFTLGNGTCNTNGQPWETCPIVISNHSGWNGSFAITGTSNEFSGYTDGTGGNNFVYTDTINSPGTATLCDNSGSPRCTGSGGILSAGDVTIASLAYKMTDLVVGDDVYAINIGGGDTTCSTNGYAVGATSATYAITGTVTTGLTVVYSVASAPTAQTANCLINNGAGFPKFTTVQNNTFLSPNVTAVTAYNTWWQPISNYFFNNVFAVNSGSNVANFYCSGQTEGTGTSGSFGNSALCWDATTLQFYSNVLVGRTSTLYGVHTGGAANAFPNSGLAGTGANTGVNCSTGSATSGCMGYSGFMSASPTVTFPTGSCPATFGNQFNCPLQSLPWANNFSYLNVSYVGGSSYSAEGVSTSALTTAFTQNGWTCASGLSCGTGPYVDYIGAGVSPPPAPVPTMFASAK